MTTSRLKTTCLAILAVLLTPLSGRSFEVLFSPLGQVESRLVEITDEAEKTLDIMMYSFTSDELAKAVVRAHKRKVSIRILLDETQVAGRHSKDKFLVESGINVRIEDREGLMHNKVAIVDGIIVITGSYNWTKSAENRNQENAIIFTAEEDEDALKKFEERFEYLWQLNAPEPPPQELGSGGMLSR